LVKDIVIYPDVLLLTPSREVTVFEEDDASLAELEKDMRDTLAYTRGVAIAAVQIGVLKRGILVGGQMYWNPVVVSRSVEMVPMQEGCLSIPGLVETVRRPSWVDLVYCDSKGLKGKERLTGLRAQAACHETDHLNAVLMTSEMDLPRREAIRNRMFTLRRAAKAVGVSVSDLIYGVKP
jgi:peptide deformylase